MSVRIEEDNPKRKRTPAQISRERKAEARERHLEAIRAGRATEESPK